MRVFLAGATGALGRQLVPGLVAAGHHVTATTRTPGKAAQLRAAGAEPLVLDGLDRDAVIAAVRAAGPEVIVHQMTALADLRSLRRFDREFAATNELRILGTDNLLVAGVQAGTRRVIAQSYAGWPSGRSGGAVQTEDDPLDSRPAPSSTRSLAAVPAEGPGPAEHAELADSLSMAFLVLLEALSPVERAVFMLREVFGYGYPEVARIIGKSEVNCRQIFARARQRITTGGQARDRAPAPARRAEGDELARRFFEAATGGSMDALLGMLAPDVIFHGDGGGKAQAIGAPVHGRQHVLRLLAGLFRRGRAMGASLRPARVNGQPGAVTYDADGRVINVFALDVADGLVQAIRSVVNPDKLGHLGPVSDLARRPERT